MPLPNQLNQLHQTEPADTASLPDERINAAVPAELPSESESTVEVPINEPAKDNDKPEQLKPAATSEPLGGQPAATDQSETAPVKPVKIDEAKVTLAQLEQALFN